MSIKVVTLMAIAQKVNGRLHCSDECANKLLINGLGSLENGGNGQIGFIANAENYHAKTENIALSAVLVDSYLQNLNSVQIEVNDVKKAWRIIANSFFSNEKLSGIHPSAQIGSDVNIGAAVALGAAAVIGDGATIGDNSKISAHAFIDAGVSIGADCFIGSGARILAGSRLGARCFIDANAVIGSCGFGWSLEEGAWQLIPQLGGVLIGDDVFIGAATTIDRATIDDTVIGNGVKLDNLIQIAHNVKIGDNTIMAAACVVAGSTSIGKNCVVGGTSVFAGHLQICDGAKFTGQAAVSKSIDKVGVYSSGIPAMPNARWRRMIATLRQLEKKGK